MTKPAFKTAKEAKAKGRPLTASEHKYMVSQIAKQILTGLLSTIQQDSLTAIDLPYFDRYGQVMKTCGGQARQASPVLALELAKWLTFEDHCRGQLAKVNTEATLLRGDALVYMIVNITEPRSIECLPNIPNVKMEKLLLAVIDAATKLHLHTAVLLAALRALKRYSRRSGVGQFSRELLETYILPSLIAGVKLSRDEDDETLRQKQMMQMRLITSVGLSFYTRAARSFARWKLRGLDQ